MDKPTPNEAIKGDSVAITRNLVEKYNDQAVLRAVVQAMPYVGGALDTMLSTKAAKIQMQRIEGFLAALSERLANVEECRVDPSDEALVDLVTQAMQRATATRSGAKRARFAQIIATQVERAAGWEEPEAAFRLLGDLDDLHISVLGVTLSVQLMAQGPFKDLKIVALGRSLDIEPADHPPLLGDLLASYGDTALRLACAELVARGLLHDEGIGRWDGEALHFLVATKLAEWLIDWITSPTDTA